MFHFDFKASKRSWSVVAMVPENSIDFNRRKHDENASVAESYCIVVGWLMYFCIDNLPRQIICWTSDDQAVIAVEMIEWGYQLSSKLYVRARDCGYGTQHKAVDVSASPCEGFGDFGN
eukprot:sb/3476464/